MKAGGSRFFVSGRTCERMVRLKNAVIVSLGDVTSGEPTSNLDIRYRRRLIRFIQSSQEAMLIASHDLEFILEVCHRVILMDNGCVIAEGNPKEIMGNNELMEVHGLERPHSLIPHTEPHHRR